MTTAAFPLRARVGLNGARSLWVRPRYGGQSDPDVQTAWLFGAAAAPAEYALALTLDAVALTATASVDVDAVLALTLPSVSFVAEMSVTAGVTQLAIGSRGSRRGGRRG